METSDSDYFESADEDFDSWDENDKKETKTSLDAKLETRTKSRSIRHKTQEHEENSRCTPDINETTTGEETQLTDLLNQNLKVESDNNTFKGNTKNVITQIPLISGNAGANVKKEDVNLRAQSEDKILVVCDDNKKEKIVSTKNNEKVSKNIEQSNKKLHNKDDTECTDIIKSNNEVDNMWTTEEDWIVEKDLEKIQDNTTKLKDNTQNTDAVEENMWENDEWEPIDKEEINCDKANSIKQNKIHSSTVKNIVEPNVWPSWGSWGVSSVLSSATQSVSTLTSSVSQGFSTVLESSIGVPDPEELARLNHTEEMQISNQIKNNLADEEYQNRNLLQFGFSNIGNLVSGVSKLVESTSTKVISGGLDTLETIGKKTMEVLQEGDPGLKRKRAFLKLNAEKPVLSQVLREAKERVEEENKALEKPIIKRMNYETLFDDHQGLVHLEALEMLSKQCEIKLQTLIESCSGESLSEIQETISQVKELCELPDEDEQDQMSSTEIKERLKCLVEEISIRITYDRLIAIWEETELWLNNLEPGLCDETELHQRAIETLARLTAVVVEQFHKTGELLFIKDHHNTADEADGLVQLTTILTSIISSVAGKFSEQLNAKASRSKNDEEINSLITNVFFEAANSSSYIQDAFQLLVPVLQVGSVKV